MQRAERRSIDAVSNVSDDLGYELKNVGKNEDYFYSSEKNIR